ncbi:MAG: carbamoyltransferase HypF [Oligoflexia bacterium]|nr:carbamoyltransferase HypF [Oligoflexia bacterium]
MNNEIRLAILIKGIVQGVGFRPTVYRYAIENSLRGFVNNSASGVVIEVEGPREKVENFVNTLRSSPPPQALVHSFEVTPLALRSTGEENHFSIIKSEEVGEKDVEISPDLATCSDCLQEIFDPENRRYHYPFTNCTNCGPRFTIIRDRPYDRKLTSMAKFPMCPKCQHEYENPLDRRFHAQPNACSVCGPVLKLLVAHNTHGTHSAYNFQTMDPLLATKKLLQDGFIIAIKGLGGFNLACDALNLKAVQNLRGLKRRPRRAFAMMMPNLQQLKRYCEVGIEEEKLLLSSAAPIVLLKKRSCDFDHISPDNNYLGVVLPYTPLHHLLLHDLQGVPLVFTSANLADEPMATTDEEILTILEQKRGIVDYALTHDRDILHRADDSLMQIIPKNNQALTIRRSRGYTPKAFTISNPLASFTLSYGANLKNTFALARDHRIYLSQHIGDLDDYRNFEYQESEIKKLSSLLEIHYQKKLGDAHPGYENFTHAETKIYHHHAHLLSVIAEHDLHYERVLGVIGDGTGYGDDGAIWGFEFLTKDATRLAHLRYFSLPGGERAIYEVERIAFALVYESTKKILPIENASMLKAMIDKNLNVPKCSSLGRLFDGVAALIIPKEALPTPIEYEGQAAILLQKLAEEFTTLPLSSFYPASLDYAPMICALLTDLENGVPLSEIAYKFHHYVVDTIITTLKQALPEANPEALLVSGGCFQNALLVSLLEEKLSEHFPTLPYFRNVLSPINDAGIALGQQLLH